MLENLTADLSVDKLAEKVAMSPRNFTRVFTRETGASPARYVAEARTAAARQRLEQTHETLDRIAEQTGFGSSINLRRLFEKQLNLTCVNIVNDFTVAKWRKVILFVIYAITRPSYSDSSDNR